MPDGLPIGSKQTVDRAKAERCPTVPQFGAVHVGRVLCPTTWLSPYLDFQFYYLDLLYCLDLLYQSHAADTDAPADTLIRFY